MSCTGQKNFQIFNDYPSAPHIDMHPPLQLSWVERKMAATLFATPPAASLPEAVEHFLRAEQLRPAGWKENRLFLAKCSIGQGEYNQAVIWLDRADSIPSASQDVREGIKVSRAEW